MLKTTFLAQSLASIASGPAFGDKQLKILIIFAVDKAEPLASPAP